MQNIKKLLSTESYSFLKTDPRLGNNIVLLGLGGSHAYGTNIEGSDVDIRGVAVNSKEDILNMYDFEHVVDPNTDTTIYSFMKIVKLLASGNPNTLEVVYLNPDQYLYLSDIGRQLINNRDIFLSSACYHSFGGYAHAQLIQLQNKSIREQSQSNREEHILRTIRHSEHLFREKYSLPQESYFRLYTAVSQKQDMTTEIFADINLKNYPIRNYQMMMEEINRIIRSYERVGKRAGYAETHAKINKHAMHLVRLLNCGIELLNSGTFSTYRKDDHDLLMSIRSGSYMTEEGVLSESFFDMVNELKLSLDKAYNNTVLPKVVDQNKIKKFIANINEQIVCS